MTHKLEFISRSAILRALEQIDLLEIPNDNKWSEYWIVYRNALFPFKYVVEVASSFTATPIDTTDFTSNDSSRNYIASLGFHILFRTPTSDATQIQYWIGANYYGLPGSQIDMLDDFIKMKYWRTDHDLSHGEGLKLSNLLREVRVNDRFCIRYLDKKGGSLKIMCIGTVADTSRIHDGSLSINWDYNPPKYSGPKPTGLGSRNWWRTLFQLNNWTDVSNIFSETLIEKRVSRLTWNYSGWVMPSGPAGKSENPDSHEARYGYGHEEWIFDTSKIIDGFHDGFLEPVRKNQEAYRGKLFNVWLYSIDGETKKRYWIGNIERIVVIDDTDADYAKHIYDKKNWLNEMEMQIVACGANKTGFSNWKGIDLFNVKFRISDLRINDSYIELPDDHPINGLTRYNFAHFREHHKASGKSIQEGFDFEPPKITDVEGRNPIRKFHFREPKAIEITYLHREISNALTKTLRSIYGKQNVAQEHYAGYGSNKIDIVVKHESALIFYEIKTYNSLRVSIREALGQLIEYCFFPDQSKATRLIIVTQIAADSDTIKYFKHLRETFNVNIYYQSFDLQTNCLSDPL